MILSTAEKWFLWLMIYSFIGWVYESAVCSVSAGKPVNRGFLNGPFCPIYGTGAVLILLALGRIQSPVVLFILGALLTCSLEYLTSWCMEKLFHARWWDYSKRRFNLHGRVCLLGAVVFGTFSVLLVRLLHPAVARLTGLLSPTAMHWICGILLVGFLTDLAVTLRGLSGTSQAVADCAELLRRRREELADRLHSAPGFEQVRQFNERLHTRLNAQQRRTLRNFPHFSLTRNNEMLAELRSELERIRKERRQEKKRTKRK